MDPENPSEPNINTDFIKKENSEENDESFFVTPGIIKTSNPIEDFIKKELIVNEESSKLYKKSSMESSLISNDISTSSYVSNLFLVSANKTYMAKSSHFIVTFELCLLRLGLLKLAMSWKYLSGPLIFPMMIQTLAAKAGPEDFPCFAHSWVKHCLAVGWVQSGILEGFIKSDS